MGNLHLYSDPEGRSARGRIQAKSMRCSSACMPRASKLHGRCRAEHGIGFAKRQYLLESLGRRGGVHEEHHAFDPRGILNGEGYFKERILIWLHKWQTPVRRKDRLIWNITVLFRILEMNATEPLSDPGFGLCVRPWRSHRRSRRLGTCQGGKNARAVIS